MRSILGLRARPEENPIPARQRLVLSSFPSAIYAVGDVHGCLSQLRRLQDLIIGNGEAISGEKLIVMLGDYVDRGPQSSSTIDFLMEPLPQGFRRICLAGNHDEMMLAHVQNPQFAEWLGYGGLETLASYGIDPDLYRAAPIRHRIALLQSHIPEIHLDFLANLPVLVSAPGVVFTHAGFRPDIPLADHDDADLMWPVHDYDSAAYAGLPLSVHGHTAAPTPQVHQHRICVDTGCFATGTLTAVRLQQGKKPNLLSVTSESGDRARA
ncbi:metallophosphoesterase family protein [Devosia beringensis]|uniref:metallophosphoesterase family protein n=1 Tax=Devosia beringensis TaxID=2657486 RepID=UPI00186BADCB|nr:metallophosphoesterase family protein [Devosia beringensis]